MVVGGRRWCRTRVRRRKWRVAVTDHTSALVAALITRLRPTGTLAAAQEPTVCRGAPRPVVELHVTEAQRDRLRPADHPDWARVLTDLQRQHQLWRAARAEDHAARDAEQHADHHAAEAPGVAARRRERAREAVARFPPAAMRRWITIRDRSCVFPPCGASALAAEIDHTRLDPDPAPGRGWFVWTSPTGHTYPRPPRPVADDLPPHPMTHPSSAEPDQYADDGPIWDRTPPTSRDHPPDPPRPPPVPPDQDPDPPF